MSRSGESYVSVVNVEIQIGERHGAGADPLSLRLPQ